MEVNMMARARMQAKLQLRILIQRPSRLLEDAIARAITDNIILLARDVEGRLIPLLSAHTDRRRKSEEFRARIGLLCGLVEEGDRLVESRGFEVTAKLC